MTSPRPLTSPRPRPWARRRTWSHSWPPLPPGRLPLLSRPIVANLAVITAVVCALSWYSFAPAPDYPVLVTIVLTAWVLMWVGANLATTASRQTWHPYRPLAGRRRGRDSRVSTLRSMLQENADPVSADDLHGVLVAVTRDRLHARGVDPHAGREERQALCGADLLAYLEAPPGARHRSLGDLGTLIARIERI